MLSYNHAYIVEKYNNQLENLFNKRYTFNMNINNEEVKEIKIEEVKNNLYNIKKDYYNVTFCTQAYLKCRELLYINHDWLNEKWKRNIKIRILHLCEAPGAFVYAIHDFYQLDTIQECNPFFEWKMNSLNPFIKENELTSFKDESGIMGKFNQNMFYGEDNTGDILNFTNNDIKKLIKNECQDKQELNVLPLIRKEILIALETLNKGGLFIVKMYTFFENETQQLIINLCQMFEKIQVSKPSCSKASNSEVYLICQNFFGEKKIINEEKIISNIIKCSEIFANYQIDAIKMNMDAFDSDLLKSKYAKSYIDSIKLEAINQYCQKIMVPISFKQ
uniref:FtsJ domain-containing protein n=1 Tax=Strongyloides stercoralis TaxID=6248 RepID=A0AAF5D0F0_STRER